MMLKIMGLDAGYGPVQVLRGLDLTVATGEIHCLVGRNGAGKTTTMKAIMGLVRPTAGRILLDGAEISALPAHQVPRRGIGYVPQGRRLFGELTVAQNLEIGLATRRTPRDRLAHVLDLFPRLRERLGQRAQTLSGGEQQMLATARALCLEPRLLLLDEPTEGLQPSMIEAIRQVIVEMRGRGVAVLLVEQRIDAVLAIADRVTFVENGQSLETVTAESLRADPDRLHRRLGI
jgi:branched-chain amino acid transport system ATP-binding protein